MRPAATALAAAALLAGATAGASEPAAPAGSIGALLQSLAGLAVVLALILGAAWLARRMTPGASPDNALARTVGAVAVGPKERLVVVEIGDAWLVLGVAPGRVNALATLPRSALPAPGRPKGSPFAELLARMRGKRDAA